MFASSRKQFKNKLVSREAHFFLWIFLLIIQTSLYATKSGTFLITWLIHYEASCFQFGSGFFWFSFISKLKKHLRVRRFLDDADDDGTEWFFKNDLIIKSWIFTGRPSNSCQGETNVIFSKHISRDIYNRQFIFYNKSNLCKYK